MDSDFTNLFEEKFRDFENYTCISMKINIKGPDDIPDQISTATSFMYDYLTHRSKKLYYMTGGIHVLGKSQKPHIHLHWIVDKVKKFDAMWRKRWLEKEKGNTDDEATLDGCEFKFQEMDGSKPRYSFLSYPLKEGRRLEHRYYRGKDYKIMDPRMLDFLEGVGRRIFDEERALELRQEKSEERKKVALTEIYVLVKDKNFRSFTEMKIWLEDNYLAKLDYDNKPRLSNYRDNLYMIGNSLGLFKYCDNI